MAKQDTGHNKPYIEQDRKGYLFTCSCGNQQESDYPLARDQSILCLYCGKSWRLVAKGSSDEQVSQEQ